MFQYSTAAETNIAVASNFSTTIQTLVQEFEKNSGHRVRISYGSSGKFVAQIQQGAPFDLFFSADQSKANILMSKGLAVPESQYTYALGALVLWTGKKAFEKDGFERLKSGNFDKLAIANPIHAPYGVAALHVLQSFGLETATQKKRVLGENIAQTYQFVQSGNADIGFVALSQILSKEGSQKGLIWQVPKGLHQPIFQDLLLLKRAQGNQAAIALWQFIKSQEARTIIESYGYKTIDNSAIKTVPKGLSSQ